MTKSLLKFSMVAKALSVTLLAAPAANAGSLAVPMTISRDTGVGLVIAAQGNAALRLIRAELEAGMLGQMKPALPAFTPTTKVASARPAGGALASANARCAK